VPRRLRLVLALVAAMAAALAAGPAAARPSEGDLKIVAEGLSNPRGLDIGPRGEIYVAEAGRGGPGPDCIVGPEGEQQCAGSTGAISRIHHGEVKRLLTGLPSLADPATGEGATGPHDVDLRRHSGGADFVVGLGANPAARAQLGELGPRFGWLYRVSRFGHVRPVADIAGYEASANPDGSEVPDSNPYSVLNRHGKSFVVDAGGNSLLRVGRSGRISTLAVFEPRLVPAPPGFPEPELPMDAVPTSVVRGPDGALYVSQLTGFPFPVGGARIYRVEPGGEPEIYAEGFTNVTGLDFGPDGRLYVVEFAANGILSGDPAGALYRIKPGGSPELVVSQGLIAPNGVAVDHKGDIYITNNSVSPDDGQVVKVKGPRRGHHH
jgi:hypothetical protein